MQINFRDVSEMGWILTSVNGWKDGPSYTRGLTAVPGRAGLLADPLTVPERRTLTATLMAYTTNPDQRDGLVSALRDATTGAHVLTFADSATVVRVRRAGAIRITTPTTAIYATTVIYADITWDAVDGIALDLQARVISIAASGSVALSVGTAPCTPVVWLTGVWATNTARTLTVTSASGLVTGGMTLTAPASPADSLTVHDALEVDMGARTITKITGAGVRTNAFGWRTSGTFLTIDGDTNAAGSASRLSVSAGTALVQYVRGWAL